MAAGKSALAIAAPGMTGSPPWPARRRGVEEHDRGYHATRGEFAEHGFASALPRRNGVAVPLVIVSPGRAPEGRRVSEPVSLRNLPQTIVQMLGLEGTPFPGISLETSWRGGPAPFVAGSVSADGILSEVGPSPGTSGLLRAAAVQVYRGTGTATAEGVDFDWIARATQPGVEAGMARGASRRTGRTRPSHGARKRPLINRAGSSANAATKS
jgi:hypothetical protein